MNCKNCGAVISENEKICLSCGAEISNDEIATEKTVVSQAKEAPAQKGLISVVLGIASFFTMLIAGTNIGLPFSIVSLIISIINFKKPEAKLASTIGLCFSAGTLAYCIAYIIGQITSIITVILVYVIIIFVAIISATIGM